MQISTLHSAIIQVCLPDTCILHPRILHFCTLLTTEVFAVSRAIDPAGPASDAKWSMIDDWWQDYNMAEWAKTECTCVFMHRKRLGKSIQADIGTTCLITDTCTPLFLVTCCELSWCKLVAQMQMTDQPKTCTWYEQQIC